MQTKQVLEKIVKRFQPFVVTTSGGYSVSIQSVNHLLAGKASIVIMDSDGFFEFIPIEQVTRISTKEGDVLLEAPTSLLESLGAPTTLIRVRAQSNVSEPVLRLCRQKL